MSLRTINAKLPDWQNVEPGSDEPAFLITARDFHAAPVVELWASLVADMSPELAIKAQKWAMDMREWRKSRQG